MTVSTLLRCITVSMFAFGLAGCQNLGGRTDAPAPIGVAPPAVSSQEAPPTRGLAPQSLAPGECGLFLWTKREDPEFTFFSKSGSERGIVLLNDEEVRLERIGVSGDLFDQEFTQQDFKVADKQEIVRLSLTPGETLVDGRRIPEATLRLIDTEGWETVIPLVGISACQPDA